MPNVENAVMMKNALVTIDGTEYHGEYTTALLTPTQNIVQELTLEPGYVLTDVDDATWTFQLAGPQNWVDGVSAYLNTHKGESVEIVLQPKKGSGQAMATFSVIALGGAFGGARGAFASYDLTMPVEGEPVFEIAV